MRKMKTIDFFKKLKLARAGGIILFCSLMVMISALSLSSLPEMAYRPHLRDRLGLVAIVCGAFALIGGAFLAFSLFKKKFCTVTSVFLTLFTLETLGAAAGVTIYLISLYARESFLALNTATSFFYYFLGLFIIAVSLLCAIATSVCFLLFLMVRRAVRAVKNDREPF